MGQHQPQDLAAQTGQQAPAPGSPRPWLPTREPALALRSPREQQTAISRPGLANPRLVSSAQGRAWPPTDHGASSPCQSSQGFPNSSVGKESTYNAGNPPFDSWVGKICWRRGRLPIPVFWPGEFHRLDSPWGCKQLDMQRVPPTTTKGPMQPT